MRFKAKLAAEQVSMLLNVVGPISRLQDTHKGAVLYLDRDFVRISCQSDSGITCFAELSKHIFLEHRIDSAADNVIVCQVDLVSLKLALQSVVIPSTNYNAKQKGGNQNNSSMQRSPALIQSLLAQQVVILKLAKRNRMPCLCLDGHATDEGSVEIHQAIPVRIMRSSDMQYHLPPKINTPHVQLELPSDRPLRSVVDKLKTMGPFRTYNDTRLCLYCLPYFRLKTSFCILVYWHSANFPNYWLSRDIVYLEASMKGDLTIRLDHDGCSLAMYYSNLMPRWDESSSQGATPPDPSSSCILKVDGSKLFHCLQWQQSHLATSSCLIGMVHNEMLVFHIVLRPEELGFFTYYLPVQYMDQGEQEEAAQWG